MRPRRKAYSRWSYSCQREYAALNVNTKEGVSVVKYLPLLKNTRFFNMLTVGGVNFACLEVPVPSFFLTDGAIRLKNMQILQMDV